MSASDDWMVTAADGDPATGTTAEWLDSTNGFIQGSTSRPVVVRPVDGFS
jgi:hypothetical protein